VEYLVSLGYHGRERDIKYATEKQKVFEFTAEAVNKRVPLVAGIGGNNTYEVVEQVRNFNIPGYDAILSASPHYNKPTQEGIYQHYQAIAENADATHYIIQRTQPHRQHYKCRNYAAPGQ
jgi:4-hydroxy-tetrahydrodipicolinate synthase